jgi:acetolactate synthase I/II/III large subunit
MNGAESIVHTLLKSDASVCFANPGTSEMHFVAALDGIPGMHCILCLAEVVVTGAADGYGRMTEKPAVSLLHCGPGLANGLSNLHNARRAKSPIVNIVGDQADYHRPLDPPLTADTENWARGVSAWTRSAVSAKGIGQDVAVAVQAARSMPGIATLIAPANTCWDEGGVVAEQLDVPPLPEVAPHRVVETARLLRDVKKPTLVLLSAPVLSKATLASAERIAKATGAKFMTTQFNARVARGQGCYPIERLSYALGPAIATLSEFKQVILVGAVPPVAPFAYPDQPGYLLPNDAMVHVFARPDQDVGKALAALASELSAPAVVTPWREFDRSPASGPVELTAFTRVLATLLPENSVVVDESVSCGRGFFAGLADAAPHDYLQITGGAIGSGLPMATGAAVARPRSRIVSLQSDGAAMYSIQALWTQAREKLNVTTIILANRKYAILLSELKNVGAKIGKVASNMLNIGEPDIGWVGMANSLGVAAGRAETIEEFAKLFNASVETDGPYLIELVI